jgi:Anaerobic ribonucleoside-triphosphate reductase
MIETQEMSRATEAAPVVLRDDERQRCEVWTRVMGYHRPMASFNTGKKGEFHERTYFTERSCRPTLAV